MKQNRKSNALWCKIVAITGCVMLLATGLQAAPE